MQRLIVRVLAVMTGIGGAVMAEAQQFQSPSGNIRCVIDDTDVTFVRCDLEVDQQSYTQRPASCEGEWGRSFGVTEAGRGFLNCATESIDGTSDPVVLPYGVILELDGVSCQSARTGMTCTNVEGGGFMVRRAEQRVF